MIPKIALVGRPNVGKSLLFNRLLGKRLAIVDEEEGVTRDRLIARTSAFGRSFIVIDTGGISKDKEAPFQKVILEQTAIALEEADMLLFVVDVEAGLTDLDIHAAEQIRKTGKPVILVINKADTEARQNESYVFLKLGFPEMIAVSAAQNWHIADLIEKALAPFPKEEAPLEKSLRIAILGRPNVGKSSLVNALLSEERCVVSPLAGTTRDSVDTEFFVNGKSYTLVDTAGIRRKQKETDVIEKFAAIRRECALEAADIAVLVIDAEEGLTSLDKKIAQEIEESGKGCLIFINKWDLVKGFRMEHCFKALEDEAHFLHFAPKIFGSAKTKRNLDKLLPAIDKIEEASALRVPTHALNTCIENAMQKNHPPMIQGKRLRVYYATQTGINPPTFVLFVNYKDLFMRSYKRYLSNQLRKTFDFQGVPFNLFIRQKSDKKKASN